MKKSLLFLSTLLVSNFFYAQVSPSTSPFFNINQTVAKLDYEILSTINGQLVLQERNDVANAFTRGVLASNMYWDKTNGVWKYTRISANNKDFAMIRFENGGNIGFFNRTNSTNSQITNTNMESYRRMTITSNGNVGIGSNNPDSKLTVKGKIHCEEVLVDLSVPADYVFQKYYLGSSILKPEYTMPTLEEVEAFTKENNHLPNVPSAKEIQENGLQIKEMTNILLQKIEELTLYTIEQEKRINALEEALNEK